MIERLVQSDGLRLGKVLSYFELCFDSIKAKLKFSEDATLDTLSQNLHCSTSIEEHFNCKILGLDEAFEVLEEQDVAHATAAQKHVANDIVERNSFSKEFF